MISTIVLSWDDAVRARGADPAGLSERLGRLGSLGVDVIVASPQVQGVASLLDGLGRPDPEALGQVSFHHGEPGHVLEALHRHASQNGRPERVVVVGQGDLETLSVGRLLAELDDVAEAAAAFPQPVEDPAWLLEVSGFDAGKEREIESWMAVGNGRTGTRGSVEEAGQDSTAAVYVAGVFGRPPAGRTGPDEPEPREASVPELVKGVQWTFLAPRVDGRAVTLDEAGESDHRRVLDMRQGILFREWRQPLSEGGEWTFRSARFASLADRRLLALHAEARATDGAVALTSDVAVPPQETVAGREGGTARFAVVTTEEDGTLERFAAVEREVLGMVEEGARAQLVGARSAGMERVRARHRRAWQERWHGADVVVDGDAHAQGALRFALYHLISSGDPESSLASVGARGLTGPGYKGHVFWDTEVFVLPFLIWTHPPTARALLAYRHRTLPAARAKAARLGFAGALYAWESADTGDEVTPPWIRLPDGTRLEIHTDVQEHHISGDVAWAVWQYWQATADREFLLGMGAEILVETARFWASRVTPGPDGRFHIRKVIGPDEYHESVDDNAFTNVLARWNLETAAEVGELLGALDPSRWDDLVNRLGLTPAEPVRWREVAAGLVDGFDPATLIYEQFTGFFALEDVRAADLAPRPFTAELVVGVDRLQHTQVVKQADVVMLAHMLPEAFPPGAVVANYRAYEPRTCHGSSLSPAIHAAVAARVGALDDADRYFRMAADVDLDDRMGNAAQGVHIATMGGLWQAAVFGFGGLRGDDEALRLDPVLPPAWAGFSFPLQWRGTRVHVDVRPDGVTLTLDGPATVALGANAPEQLGPGGYVARRLGHDWSAMEAPDRM